MKFGINVVIHMCCCVFWLGLVWFALGLVGLEYTWFLFSFPPVGYVEVSLSR